MTGTSYGVLLVLTFVLIVFGMCGGLDWALGALAGLHARRNSGSNHSEPKGDDYE